MASSTPHAHSEHVFATNSEGASPASSSSSSSASSSAAVIHISIPSSFSPADPFQQVTSQPPSPNGISAAAILATLSDSRPPSSHVGHIHAFPDDDEPGGIVLTSYIESSTAPEPPLASHYAPEDSGDAAQVSMDQIPHTALDQHASALEALTMEQLPTPSFPMAAPDNLDALMSIPLFSAHPDFVPSMYEEHLSIQDNTAFVDISTFVSKYARKPKPFCPPLEIVQPPETVTREDLNGDKCDFQGIDWTERGSRSEIRAQRNSYEEARIRQRIFEGHEGHGITHQHRLRDTENYFAFQRINTTHRVACPHFQLRNLMTTLSRNDIFYATRKAVFRTDALGSPAVPIIDLQKRSTNGSPCQVTTLAAQDNVLIAGGFEGDFAIADLSSTNDESVHYGTIRDYAAESKSYISNHVHMFNSRTSCAPQAALCSNDYHLRVLDCTTGTVTHSFSWPTAVNCSATSPDGRMRVIVGDFYETIIANAETGQPFETLNAHSDHAFACAWADDGIHVASAAQDATIAVWDARFWQRPLVVMPSELSIPRVLRFSPIGGGPRVLVSAEADDYLSIINAQTWDSKQVFDFFGPVGGLSLTPDGQSLFIANSDRRFGGIIELERTGRARHDASRSRSKWMSGDTYANHDSDGSEHADWGGDSDLEVDPRVVDNARARERRGVDLGHFVL